MIIWRKAPKKRLFMALCAKFKFETDVFFMILRSKNMKNTSVLKEYSAAEGGKNLFTQPRNDYLAQSAEKKTFHGALRQI
jgi:hypothetical protein